MICETRLRVLEFKIIKKPDLFEISWFKEKEPGLLKIGRELLPICVPAVKKMKKNKNEKV